jgi:NADPH-dependent curcumin reductase
MADSTVTAVLLDRPCIEGLPTPDFFRIVSLPKPELSEIGGILVQTLVASADPYLRGRFKTMPAGAAVEVFQAGRVIGSTSPAWAVGDLWGGRLPLITEQFVSAARLATGEVWRLTGLVDEAHISYGIGVLGMPGATAYGGVVDVLRPNAGDTLFVSAAAGAVGSLAGQIAKKRFGCKVVGSAGGPAKCDFVVKSLGFDACLDYKAAGNSAEKLGAALKEAAPAGIDMYVSWSLC